MKLKRKNSSSVSRRNIRDKKRKLKRKLVREKECVVIIVPAEVWLVCGKSYRDTRLTASLMWVGNVAVDSTSLKSNGESSEVK